VITRDVKALYPWIAGETGERSLTLPKLYKLAVHVVSEHRRGGAEISGGGKQRRHDLLGRRRNYLPPLWWAPLG